MQKIREIASNICYIEITMIFMKSKYFLLKKIFKNNDFASLNLVIAANRKKEVYIIISHLYKSNIQIY